MQTKALLVILLIILSIAFFSSNQAKALPQDPDTSYDNRFAYLAKLNIDLEKIQIDLNNKQNNFDKNTTELEVGTTVVSGYQLQSFTGSLPIMSC